MKFDKEFIICEDVELFAKICQLDFSYTFLEEALYTYNNVNTQSLTHQRENSFRLYCFIKAFASYQNIYLNAKRKKNLINKIFKALKENKKDKLLNDTQILELKSLLQEFLPSFYFRFDYLIKFCMLHFNK